MWRGYSADGILDDSFSSAGATCSGQPVAMTISTFPPSLCDGKDISKEFTLRLHSSDRTSSGSLSDPSVTVYICANSGGARTFISQGSNTGDTTNPRRVIKTIRDIPTS